MKIVYLEVKEDAKLIYIKVFRPQGDGLQLSDPNCGGFCMQVPPNRPTYRQLNGKRAKVT